jgi:hypothetical protein
VNQAAVFLSVAAAVQMAAIWVGGKLDGLEGVAFGMLAVAVLQALVTAPSVLRTAYGSASARAATAPAHGISQAGPAIEARRKARMREADDAMRLRQEAGLAALFSVATAVAPDRSRATGASRRGGEATSWLASVAPPQARADRGHGRFRHPATAVTAADRALRETGEWADVDEATFHTRQEAGMAALIAIATHAARF